MMLAVDAHLAVTTETAASVGSGHSDTVVFVNAVVSELADVAKPTAKGADLVLLRSDADGEEQIQAYLQNR